ncbi:type 2 lanthipeptide synthetase LanM family protein [Actinophytocola sp. KF-1]
MGEFWWVPALALHERCAAPLPPPVATDDAERWRDAFGADGLAGWLADHGLDEATLAAVLAESPDRTGRRVPRPGWVPLVERAVRAGVPAVPAVPAGWQDAFALPLSPLVAEAAAMVRAAADGTGIDVDGVVRSFSAGLSRRLVAVAARTFVAELHAQRGAGVLAGDDPAARFADFVARLARPGGLAGLFIRYPVLARLLGQACEFAADATVELLRRFAADRDALVAGLLGGVDPGALVRVVAGLGDAHQRGRTVSMVVFADGRRVVYRPRDVGTHLRFGELVRRLNDAAPGLGLRSVAVLPRAGYGWLEHVPHRAMTDPGEVDRFYRRQGALLALLHVLDGADIHCENLIAVGDQPVLIDVETMFHPDLPQPGVPRDDPATRAFGSSVHRTALLPFPVVGEHGVLDISGLGGDAGATTPASVVGWDFAGTDRMRLARRPAPYAGARNRPRIGDRPADPVDHEPALQDGFRLGYHAIMARRAEFAAYVETCADVEVRVVARPTDRYAFLLDESTHPALLRDALERDLVLGELCRRSAADPVRRRLVAHELADLWAGQVPLFTARPGARHLWSSAGRRIDDVLERTGVRGAVDKLRDMGEADRRTQAWVVSAALATRRRTAGAEDHVGAGPVPGAPAGAGAHPQRLLVAACALADQLVAASQATPSRVNWLGLELVDRRQWAVLPMGGGLADGYLGVALFLAQLADLSGIARYADTARAAVGAVPALLATLAERAGVLAIVGRGGLRGLGGLAYGLARLATLLDDTGLRDCAATAVDLAARAPSRPGWADGDAGCLAAMRAVAAELGLATAARLAAECATRTAAHVSGTGLPAGFADGLAGLAWALTGADDEPAHAAAARHAIDRLPPGDAATGWCRGAAGIAIARSHADPAAAATALLDRPVLRDLSLCHGELGVMEAVTELAGRAGDRAVTVAARRRAGLVLAALDRYGPSCGTPGSVSTPGLVSGWAGIGYGLLRLGFPGRVPSVLLLQPSRNNERKEHHA